MAQKAEIDTKDNIKEGRLVTKMAGECYSSELNNLLYSSDEIDFLLKKELESIPNIKISPNVPTYNIGNNKELSSVFKENLECAFIQVIEHNKTVVVPIHQGPTDSGHWTVMVIKKEEDTINIKYNDSLGNSIYYIDALLEEIALHFESYNYKLNIIDYMLKQQDNSYDCGPFTVENARRMCLGEDLYYNNCRDRTAEDVNELRRKHSLAITNSDDAKNVSTFSSIKLDNYTTYNISEYKKPNKLKVSWDPLVEDNEGKTKEKKAAQKAKSTKKAGITEHLLKDKINVELECSIVKDGYLYESGDKTNNDDFYNIKIKSADAKDIKCQCTFDDNNVEQILIGTSNNQDNFNSVE